MSNKTETGALPFLLMMNRMAWRNLFRRKRRTFITTFSVAFGIMLAVTFTGMGDYSYTDMIDTSAAMGLGHITVEPKGYNYSPTLDKRLANADGLRQNALQNPEVEDAIVRIMGQAMFSSASKSVGGIFLAVDPSQESPERNFFLRSIVEGSLFEGTKGRGALIGAKLAQKLNLRIGKKLVYTVTDTSGEIVGEMARVVGIFKTNSNTADGSFVILPIDRVRATLNYGKTEASIVAVFIDDQRRAERVRTNLEKAVGNPNVDVLGWKETQSSVAGLVAMDKSSNYFFQFFVGLLVAAGILNTLLMSVLERKREFGVMMAVGLTPGRLFILVLIESVWVGILGLIMGVIITTPWFIYLSEVGIDLTKLIGGEYEAGGVPVDPVMRIRLFKESAMAILATLFFLTVGAGLYPAYKAGRTPPVESIKNI